MRFIQPLQTNDIRARNLAGRHQISKDGRHLVDGIAFGRPLLRAPSHAPIHIPPRKRARLDPELEESDAALQLGDYGPPPSAPESAPTTAPPPKQAPPSDGKQRTRARNRRRRDAKKLTWLKSTGKLPESATRQDLKKWREDQKREALLAALQSGGIDVNHDLSAPSEDTVMANADLNTLYVGDDSPPAQPEPRRARLDIASSNRLLFNSLGVRAPKNDADRQRLQAKLAQPTRKPVTKPAPATAASIEQLSSAEEDQDPTDIDAWKSKISLSAVECAPGSEEYYYSTPPFPFYQRWDPSQRTKKRKPNSQAFDSAKLQRTEGEIDNSYNDYYNDGADGDALNYGDDEDDTAGAAQEADQEAATAQLLAESSDAADLPALPSDLTTLPPLTPETTVPGAIITFARFEVSAATNWAPAMSPVRTASIQHVSDNKTLGLQLAKRDIPGKQYDSQGRRLFDKFEMITGDEEDEEEHVGFLEVELAELIDARLLQAAEVAQKTVGVDEQGGIEEKGEEQMIGIAL
ncbi:hypothetical protein D6D00_10040 [Aureobasidium pullulans]|nr:hypothetical protein D6D00_10040 [Aureobasidium pullulans]